MTIVSCPMTITFCRYDLHVVTLSNVVTMTVTYYHNDYYILSYGHLHTTTMTIA